MNNKGFVLAWLSILLVVLIGALGSFSSLLITQWNKQRQVEFCRYEMKQIQQYASNQAKTLLALNPQSIQLRTELLNVDRQIIAALAAGQIAAVKLLKIRRLAIRLRQKKLDMTQQMIIKTTHATLKSKVQVLRLQLQTLFDKNHKSYMAPTPATRFAFKPSDQMLAPTYEPYKQFEKSQSMAISWVEHYKWGRWLQTFSYPNQIRSQCRLTLREGSWLPIIQKDRL